MKIKIDAITAIVCLFGCMLGLYEHDWPFVGMSFTAMLAYFRLAMK